MRPREHPEHIEIRKVARPASRSIDDIADAVGASVAEAIRACKEPGYYVKAVMVSCDRVDPETRRPKGTRHPVIAVFWPQDGTRNGAQDGTRNGALSG
jgi:orotate phosphoribosyltransferase